jgi:LEA14-like dessication related protein
MRDADARMRLRPRLLAGGLLVAATSLWTSACGALLPPLDLKPPTVAFKDFVVDSVSSERVRFTLKVATRNPNAIDLPLSNLYFDLALFGQQVALGRVPEQRFTLPANGDRELPVAFDVATADLRALLARLTGTGTGSVDPVWEIKGTANWGNSPLPIPFSRRGDASGLRRLLELLGR